MPKAKFGLLRRIPKKFELFGHQVTVKFEKPPVIVSPEDPEECDGYFRGIDQTIVLTEGLNDSFTLEVFCHEWFEAANWAMDLQLEHNKITSLGNLLAQMLRSGK
jgi:hypothetical protein